MPSLDAFGGFCDLKVISAAVPCLFESSNKPTEYILASPGPNAFGPLSPVTVTIVDNPLTVVTGYNFVFCIWIVFNIGCFLAANIDCVVAAVLGLHDVGAIVLVLAQGTLVPWAGCIQAYSVPINEPNLQMISKISGYIEGNIKYKPILGLCILNVG
jgi:hypothetical protein